MTTITVRFVDLDPYGHVNHAVYLSYFEQGRIDILATHGLGLSDLRARGFQLIVVEATVAYQQSLRESDVVHVHTQLRQIRAASSRWEQQLTRGGAVVATNNVRIAVTDIHGKPVRAPQDILDALEAIQQSQTVVQ